MKLLGFECRKILTRKIMWIFFAFFCLNMGSYYIYMIPYIPTYEQKEIRKNWEMYLEESGENPEKNLEILQMEQAKQDPENVTELNVLNEMCQEYVTVLEYREFIDGLKDRADSMKSIAIFNKTGGYSEKNILKTIKDFKTVENLDVKPINDTGMKTLHSFYVTDILMLLLVCLFCFQTYGKDYKNGMGNLIRVTPKGGGRLRLAQMEAVSILVLIAGFVLYGTNLLWTEKMIGFGNPSLNIQGMGMFRNVSFLCTVRQYLMFFLIWKLLALVFNGLVFQLFTVAFRGHNIAWVFNLMVIVISFLLWFLLPNSPEAKMFRYLNPIGLLDVGEIIGNYQNLKVFQSPVSLLNAAVGFMGISGCILIICILRIKGKSVVRVGVKVPGRKTKHFARNIFSYEFYKILVNQRVWLVIIVLMMISIWTVRPWQPHVSREEFNYEFYLEPYKGEYEDRKVTEIEKICEKQDFFDEEQVKVYEGILQQAKYLQQLKIQKKGFVSYRLYKDIFFYEQMEVKNMLYIVLAMLLSVNSLFYQDIAKRMEQLFITTPKHTSVYWAKMKLSALLGATSSLIVWGITYMKYFLHQEVEGAQFSIHSICQFAEMKYDGSIFSYMVISFFLRLFIGMYIGIILGFLSQIFVIPTQNIICSVLLFVLPLCMGYISQMGYENALIVFINQHLSLVLKPMKLLYAFPVVWFQMKLSEVLLFIAIPLLCLFYGKSIWEKKRN